MQADSPIAQNLHKIIVSLLWYPILVIILTTIAILFTAMLCLSHDCSTSDLGAGYLIITMLGIGTGIHLIAFPLGVRSCIRLILYMRFT